MSDLYADYVVSLLHFDGTDGATTTTDELGLTWTFDGSAELDTAQAKFGVSSLECTQYSGASIVCSDASLKIGAGDFTIEGWIRPYGARANGVIFTAPQYESLNLYIDSLKVRYFDPEVGYDTTSLFDDGPTLSIDVWYHFAVTRDSGTVRAFIDGVKWGEETGTHDVIETGFRWGAISSGSGRCHAWLDELRITKGVARYTANFTPPSAPFSLDPSDTVTVAEETDEDYADTVTVAEETDEDYADTVTVVEVADGIILLFAIEVTDTLTLVETLPPPAMGVSSTETVTLTETATGQVNPRTLDTVTLTEVAGGMMAITQARADVLTLTERTPVRVYGATGDTLTLTESVGGVWAALSTDAVTVIETAAGLLAITQASADSIRIAEAAGGLVSVPGVDLITVTETLGARVRGFETASDIVTLAETLGGLALARAVASDMVTLTETAGGVLAITSLSTDLVWIGEGLGVGGQQVIVVNADTGAPSEYVLAPSVNGLGELDDVLYLATDEGLFALDAADDNGAAIAWEMRTGFGNLGQETLKRLDDMNVLLRAAGAVAAIVVSERAGVKQERFYQLVTQTRTASRDGVVDIGRGLRSVNWTLGVKGLGPAEIDEIRPTVIDDTRRRR